MRSRTPSTQQDGSQTYHTITSTSRGYYKVKFGVLRTNLTIFVFTKHDHLGLFKEGSMWGTMASAQGALLQSNLGSSDLAKHLLFLHHTSKRHRLGPLEKWFWARRPKPSKVKFELWVSFELQQNAETRHYFLYNIYSKNAEGSVFAVSDMP